MSRTCALVVAAVCVSVAVAGCATAASVKTSAGNGAFVKPANALLAHSGLHRLSDGRTLAVGSLRYWDRNGGFWAIMGDRLPGTPLKTLAILTDTSAIHVNLWPLDGQYVLVEGTAAPGKPLSIMVDAFRLVVDVVHPYPSNVFSKPGLYTLEKGDTLALGWLDHRSKAARTGWVITDALAKGDKPAGKVLAELINVSAEEAKTLTPGWYFDVTGVVTGKAPLGPAFQMSDGSGATPPWVSHGQLMTGMPPAWRHVERPGLKDLAGGRKRIVGAFLLDSWTDVGLANVSVSGEWPWIIGVMAPLATVDLTRITSSLPHPASGWVWAAADGRITSETSPVNGFSGARIPHMVADSFTVLVTNPNM